MTFESEGQAPTAPLQSALGDKAKGTLIETILASLDDAKAEDVVSLNIAGKSALADYMVIVSGRSHRHVGAIADHLLRDLKEAGYGNPRAEGQSHCDWVLVDAGDVIVHVFRPEVRGFYNLERMWAADSTETPHYVG
ncbi:ribosome silencing factor [Pannonibacter carbonis]|uniref:ribosome silencing factor n=1 Tax=Pannonibacter carbonis TaxID=2067569 RepID=UPI000D113BAC|nr:ribosome silencing factor [Pannonibacter carbonis]